MISLSRSPFVVAGLVAIGISFAAVPTVRAAAVTLPGDNKVENVDFERHLMGLFGRMGCNSGSCHGSFQGKGGFRLSLFGYDPEKDYTALTREALGRRINPLDPDKSLLLLKATGQSEHGGGKRFEVNSWQYNLVREWIVAGANWTKNSGEVRSMRILPEEQAFKKAGESASLKVLAVFPDGSEHDITALCDYRTNNDAVAEVSHLGQVKALRAGDTAVVVAYRGTVMPVRILVPAEAAPDFKYPDVKEINYIDVAVHAKLRRLNIVPSDLAGDSEFLRRVTLDTIGCLPTPEEARAFLSDKNPDKRAKKIDELLAHPLHAALWATKFSDITGNNTDLLENPVALKIRRSQQWHDWFRKRVADNMPYDEIVRGVLVATSRDEGEEPEDWIKKVKDIDDTLKKGFGGAYAERKSLDLFWRRQANVPLEQWGEKTAAAFLGVRLECAQCHKHPVDRWTQADYRAYANLFASVNLGVSPEAKKVIEDENKARGIVNGRPAANNATNFPVREVFIGQTRNLFRHPDTNETLGGKALGGPEIKLDGKDPRAALYEWMRSPDNPYFARSFTNRIWGHYFGIGIVNPVDDFSQANPPSNPQLLNALARDFIDHKFDIRHMERTILNSHTYQRAFKPNATNRFDDDCFSRSRIRPMMAEVVVDTLNSALGVSENFGNDAPPNVRCIELGASRVQNASVMHVLRVFGRPPRTAACDCERAMDPALPQKLFMMTDTTLLAKFKANDGRLTKLLKTDKSNDEMLEELFLATLTRLPTDKEKEHFADYMKNAKDRSAAFTDVIWALINTREFILNH